MHKYFYDIRHEVRFGVQLSPQKKKKKKREFKYMLTEITFEL